MDTRTLGSIRFFPGIHASRDCSHAQTDTGILSSSAKKEPGHHLYSLFTPRLIRLPSLLPPFERPQRQPVQYRITPSEQYRPPNLAIRQRELLPTHGTSCARRERRRGRRAIGLDARPRRGRDVQQERSETRSRTGRAEFLG